VKTTFGLYIYMTGKVNPKILRTNILTDYVLIKIKG